MLWCSRFNYADVEAKEEAWRQLISPSFGLALHLVKKDNALQGIVHCLDTRWPCLGPG
jgi:hypothetical protein